MPKKKLEIGTVFSYLLAIEPQWRQTFSILDSYDTEITCKDYRVRLQT